RGGWVVSGGTSGFGLATAEWLASQGATDLWLASRSGRLAPADRARLRAHGARVRAVRLDLADDRAVQRFFRSRAREGADLRGIVHAAGQIADAPVERLDLGGIDAVMGAKLGGAHALDRASRAFALDHFWLFSSLAARLGNPGQAPYVAANLALEALARARHRDGLPALAVAWGPVADTGMLARDPARAAALERQLGRMPTATELLNRLKAVLARDPARATITIAPFDPARLSGLALRTDPLFAALGPVEAAGDAGTLDLPALIQSEGPARARRRVLALLVAETARILRAAPDESATQRHLADRGVAGLMGASRSA